MASPYLQNDVRGGAVGFEQALQHRIEHDLGADIRAVTQLALWVAEDMETAGLGLPDIVSRHVMQIQHRGAMLQRFSEKISAYRQVGQHRIGFNGDWRALVDTLPFACDLRGVSHDLSVPAIQVQDLGLLLTVLSDQTPHVIISLTEDKVDVGLILKATPGQSEMDESSSVCLDAERHHVMVDGTLNRAILDRIVQRYLGRHVRDNRSASIEIWLPVRGGGRPL